MPTYRIVVLYRSYAGQRIGLEAELYCEVGPLTAV